MRMERGLFGLRDLAGPEGCGRPPPHPRFPGTIQRIRIDACTENCWMILFPRIRVAQGLDGDCLRSDDGGIQATLNQGIGRRRNHAGGHQYF